MEVGVGVGCAHGRIPFDVSMFCVRFNSATRTCSSGKAILYCDGQYFIGQAIQRIVGDGFVLLRAKDQANRRVFMLVRPVFAGVVQVEMHLSGVGVSKHAQFQIDDHQAAQPAMKEQQVDSIPRITDPQPPLPAHESKVSAQFQQETFQVPDQASSKSVSEYSSFKPKNSKTSGSLISSSGDTASAGNGFSPFAQHGGLVAGKQRPLVELAGNLPAQLSAPTSRHEGPRSRRTPGPRVFNREQLDVMGPRERKLRMPAADFADGVCKFLRSAPLFW